MVINIPNEQVLTIGDLAKELQRHEKWKSYRVNKSRKTYWDIAFVDRDGEKRWMTLDGMVYDNSDCAEPEVEWMDYRDILDYTNLVWVTDTKTGETYGIES